MDNELLAVVTGLLAGLIVGWAMGRWGMADLRRQYMEMWREKRKFEKALQKQEHPWGLIKNGRQ